MRIEEVGFPLVFLTPTVRSAEAPWPRGLPHAGCGAGAARRWASRTPRVRPVLSAWSGNSRHTVHNTHLRHVGDAEEGEAVTGTGHAPPSAAGREQCLQSCSQPASPGAALAFLVASQLRIVQLAAWKFTFLSRFCCTLMKVIPEPL